MCFVFCGRSSCVLSHGVSLGLCIYVEEGDEN